MYESYLFSPSDPTVATKTLPEFWISFVIILRHAILGDRMLPNIYPLLLPDTIGFEDKIFHNTHTFIRAHNFKSENQILKVIKTLHSHQIYKYAKYQHKSQTEFVQNWKIWSNHEKLSTSEVKQKLVMSI